MHGAIGLDADLVLGAVRVGQLRADTMDVATAGERRKRRPVLQGHGKRHERFTILPRIDADGHDFHVADPHLRVGLDTGTVIGVLREVQRQPGMAHAGRCVEVADCLAPLGGPPAPEFGSVSRNGSGDRRSGSSWRTLLPWESKKSTLSTHKMLSLTHAFFLRLDMRSR